MAAVATIEMLFRSNGGPAAGGTNGAAGMDGVSKEIRTEAKRRRVDADKVSNFNTKFLRGQLGLNFSTGAIMKQSQIFTSTVGVIFQLLGALVDVMLAPLIPLFIPALRTIASWIPVAGRIAQNVIAPVVKDILDRVRSFGAWITEFKNQLFGEDGVNIMGGLGWLWNEFLTKGLPGLGRFSINLGGLIMGALGGIGDWLMSLPTIAMKSIGWFVQWFLMFPNMAHKIVGPIFNMLKGFVVGFGKVLWGFGKAIIKMAFPVIGHFFTWAMDQIFKLPKLLAQKGMDLVAVVWGKISPALSKIPIIGKHLNKIGPAITKAGGLGAAISGVAKMSKAIPVLGSVATLGFGAMETIKMTKEHGIGAGIATAGKTAAATGLAAFGMTPAALAVDIGGTAAIMALAAATKSQADAGMSTADRSRSRMGAINLSINNYNTDGTLQDTHNISDHDARKQETATGAIFTNEMGHPGN